MAPTPDETILDDDRDVLQLSADENSSLCTGCTRCCETVCVEIDAPRAPWEYDQWVWVLHHRNLEIYVEKPERWFLHIETRCEKLDHAGRCGIYETRPALCREYDPRNCERRAPLSDVSAWFRTAADLERWLAERRPSHWARLLAHREARENASAKAVPALVQIAAAAAHEPATRLPGVAARGAQPER